MKRKVSAMLMIAMMINFSPAIAAEGSYVELPQGLVKAAVVESIGTTGANLGTDKTNAAAIEDNVAAEIGFSDGQLSVEGQIGGMDFSVVGGLRTTNENCNAMLFEGSDQKGNFEVAYLAIERDLSETALFFRDFQERRPEYKNAVKLYMQQKNTNGLVQIEIFVPCDFVEEYLVKNSVAYEKDIAHELLYWFVDYYDGTESEQSAIQPRATTEPTPIDLSKTYTINGATVTFRFVVDLEATTSDVVVGGAGISNCVFRITESRVVSDVESNNSSTQTTLRLEKLNIKYKPSSNFFLVSQQPTRYGINGSSGNISGGFSLSFSYAWKELSLGGSIDFNRTSTMSDTALYPFPIPVDGYGVKGTESGELPTNYYLVDVGDCYGIQVTYQDIGPESTAVRQELVQVTFDYYVSNWHNLTDSEYGTKTSFCYINVR